MDRRSLLKSLAACVLEPTLVKAEPAPIYGWHGKTIDYNYLERYSAMEDGVCIQKQRLDHPGPWPVTSLWPVLLHGKRRSGKTGILAKFVSDRIKIHGPHKILVIVPNLNVYDAYLNTCRRHSFLTCPPPILVVGKNIARADRFMNAYGEIYADEVWQLPYTLITHPRFVAGIGTRTFED